MGRSLILETTFLIDLEREARRAESGPAHSLLTREESSALYLTFTVAGELAAGTSLGQRVRWERFLRPFEVLPSSADVSWRYGELYRHLSRNGMLIGTNDLWIAATSLAHEMPLVTNNTAHFARIPHLELVDYADESRE